MQGIVPIGERPCFLGSPGLGRCHLGNSAVLLRDRAVHPKGSAYLPGRITCLGMPGLRGPKLCRVPDCLGKYSTLPEKHCLLGKTGNCLPGRAHSLLGKECYLQGKPGNCLPGRDRSGKEHCLPGRTGNCLPGRAHSLPVRECYLLGKPEDCLPGRYCSGEECSLWGGLGITCLRRPGIDCLGDCPLCQRKTAVCQGSLGTTCLGDST